MGAKLSNLEGRPVSRTNAESGSNNYKNSAASLTYTDYKLIVDEDGKRRLVSPEEAALFEIEQKVKAQSVKSKESTLERIKRQSKSNETAIDSRNSESFKSNLPSEKETVYESVIESSNAGENENDEIPTIDDLKLSKIPGTPKDKMVAVWLDDHVTNDDFIQPPLPKVPPPSIPKDALVEEWLDDHVAKDEYKPPSIPKVPPPATRKDKLDAKWMDDHVADDVFEPPPLPKEPPPPLLIQTKPNLEWPENDDEKQLPLPTEITHLVVNVGATKPREKPPPPPPAPSKKPPVVKVDAPEETQKSAAYKSPNRRKEKKEGFFQRAFSIKKKNRKVSLIQEAMVNDNEKSIIKEKSKEKPEKTRKVSSPKLFGNIFDKPEKNRMPKKGILHDPRQSIEGNVKDSFSVGDDFSDLRPLEVDPKSDDDYPKKKRKSASFFPLQKSISHDNTERKKARDRPMKNVSWSDSDISRSNKKIKKNNSRHVVKDDKYYDDIDVIQSDEDINNKKKEKKDRRESEENAFQRSFSVPHILRRKEKSKGMEETGCISSEHSDFTDDELNKTSSFERSSVGRTKANKQNIRKKGIKETEKDIEETGSTSSVISEDSYKKKKEQSLLRFSFIKPKKSKPNKPVKVKKDQKKEIKNKRASEETGSMPSEYSDFSDDELNKNSSFERSSPGRTKAKKQNRPKKGIKETEKAMDVDETASISSVKSEDYGKRKKGQSNLRFSFMKPKKTKSKNLTNSKKDERKEIENIKDTEETSSMVSDKSDVSDKRNKERSSLRFSFMKPSGKRTKVKKQPDQKSKQKKHDIEDTSSISTVNSDVSDKRKKKRKSLQLSFLKPKGNKRAQQPKKNQKEVKKQKKDGDTSSIASEKSDKSERKSKGGLLKPSAKRAKEEKRNKEKQVVNQKGVEDTSSITSEKSDASEQGKTEKSVSAQKQKKKGEPPKEKSKKTEKNVLPKIIGTTPKPKNNPSKDLRKSSETAFTSKANKKLPNQVGNLIQVFGSNDFHKPDSEDDGELYSVRDISFSSEEDLTEKTRRRNISIFSSKNKKTKKQKKGPQKQTKDPQKQRTDEKHIKPLIGPDGNFHNIEQPIEKIGDGDSESSQVDSDDETSKRKTSFFSLQNKTQSKKKEKYIKPLPGADEDFHQTQFDNASKSEKIDKKNKNLNKDKDPKRRKSADDKKEANFLSFTFGSKGSLKEKNEKPKKQKTEPKRDSRQTENNKDEDKSSGFFNFGSNKSLGKSKDNKTAKPKSKPEVRPKSDENEKQIKDDDETIKTKTKPEVSPKSEKNKKLIKEDDKSIQPKTKAEVIQKPDGNKNKFLSIFGSKDAITKNSDKSKIIEKSTSPCDGSESSGISSENTKCSSPEIIKSDSGLEFNSMTSSIESGLNIKSPVGIWGPKRKNQVEKGSYCFAGDEPELVDETNIVLKGFKKLDDEGRTLLRSKDYGRARPTSYHEVINKKEFSLRSFSIGNELNTMSDTESADHGSTDKTSVTKLTEDGIKKNKFNFFDLVRRSKDRVEDSEQGKIIGETAKDVASAPVEGDRDRVVYAELDIVRGAAEASMRRDNDPDKTEYAEIIHPNPPLSKKEELRKSRENLADPGPELTTTPDGKKEAAV